MENFDIEKTKKSKEKIRKVFAWIGLAILAVILINLVRAMLSGNAKLTITLMFVFVLVSVIMWLGLQRDKRNRKIEKENESALGSITNIKTKNIQ